MRLHEFIHAPTRPSWTARLVAYIALIATITLVVQILHVVLW